MRSLLFLLHVPLEGHRPYTLVVEVSESILGLVQVIQVVLQEGVSLDSEIRNVVLLAVEQRIVVESSQDLLESGSVNNGVFGLEVLASCLCLKESLCCLETGQELLPGGVFQGGLCVAHSLHFLLARDVVALFLVRFLATFSRPFTHWSQVLRLVLGVSQLHILVESKHGVEITLVYLNRVTTESGLSQKQKTEKAQKHDLFDCHYNILS